MPQLRIGKNISISELEQMLAVRKGRVHKLEKKRNKLARQLEELESEIHALGGGSGSRSGGRARNKQSLAETITAILKSGGQPMKVAEIVRGALSAGYRSSSPNFRGIVNQTLIKERKRFASAGRGVYQLKRG